MASAFMAASVTTVVACRQSQQVSKETVEVVMKKLMVKLNASDDDDGHGSQRSPRVQRRRFLYQYGQHEQKARPLCRSIDVQPAEID